MTSDAREDRSAVPVDGPGVPSGFESHLLDQVEAAVIATDLAGTIIHWNRRAEQLCGRPREDALGLAIVETAFPEADRARLDETMAEVRGGGRWDGELPVRRRDGASFPAFVTLSALRDADGHVAGVAGVFVDVTEQRRLREEVQRSRDQLDVILRVVADGITVQDPSGQLVFANDAAARAIGFSTAEELVATPVADVMRRFEVMDEDGNPLPLEELPGRRALKGETDVGRVLRFRVRATGEERWSMVKASPILGPDGSVPMALNIFHDITEAKLAEHAERFLGESSALLSSSLDLERTLTTLTTLAVPALADWCIVDMAQEDGSIRQLAVAHADPEKAELARELRRRYPPDPAADHPIPRAIATGKSDLVSHIGDDDLAVQAFDDEHRAMLEALGTRSHMVVPIAARGRILGAISFVSGVPGRYSEGDLQVAEDLAARAALAVDNARLYREAKDTALRAQEALALLDALVDRAPIGFAFLDRDLRFVRVNETMARMDGVPAEEHFGRRLGQVVPNLDPVASQSMQRVLATGRPVVNVEHPGPGPGVAGRPWFWSSSFYPVRSEQGLLGVGMVVADISHRKQTEQRLAAQSAVARILAESDTVADAAPRVLMALCHHLRWDVGHLWVVDEAGDRLRYVAGWHDPTAGLEGFVRESAETTFPRGVGLPGRAWASATPEWVEDVRDETVFPRAAVAAPLGLRTGVAFPMAIGTQVLGVIELLGRTPRARDEDAIDLKAAIGNQLGQFVERKGAEEAVRESEERLRLALDAGRMGTWRWDLATGGVAWDETLEALFGLDAGTFGGTYEDYLELLHPDDRAWVVEAIDRSVSTRSGHHFEHRAVRRGGEVRWLEAWGWVTLGPEGAVTGMTGVAVDVTERRLAEEERSKLLALEQAAREGAERAQRRLAFLAEASAVLGSSLDYRSTLRRVAELAVPTLADWCAVDMVDPEGRLQSLAVAHIDPDKARFAEELRRRYPPDADAPSGTARVARTGEPEMVEDIPEEAIEAAARDEEHLRLLRELRLRSYMCVPITARGRVLGTLTLVFAESGRRFGPTDLELAGALAARAAVAVENARLYEERSYVARTLQRSLLPPQLPEVPGFQLAARYHAAGEGNEVGGDFYDVFDTGDGGWGIIMGDVCGRGADAAALTGLARHTIRAAAMRDRRPSQILATLNEAIIQQRSDQSFCTVCYVRVHPGDDGGARLTVACGGHPLPLVLRRDGSVEETGTPGTLIGVFPDPEIADRPTDLDPGDVLVLYTDGVTESRGGRGIYGEDRLRAVLSSCVGLDAATVAERIEEDVLRHKPDASDDIAILVARLEG